MDVPEDLLPIYSNLVRITHSPSEIILDFSRMLPGQLNPHVLARILMSPIGAKLLLRALAENIARYEGAFGEIRMPGESPLANDLFRQAKPPESP
ncbi:MAG TPA: DUF3467 domain-containing protein [Anaerolineaceae bacterium]|jgi:hypothetical protein|nr:DUF3467 domain-containing protein [Anaerolineaceae bacterium]